MLMVPSDDATFGRVFLTSVALTPWEEELVSRVVRTDMAGWQRKLLVGRMVRTRASWPRDEVLGVQISCPTWLSGVTLTVRAELPGAQELVVQDGSRFWHEVGILPAGTREVRVRAQVDLPGKEAWFDDWITVPVVARESREACHKPVSTRASARAVRAFVRPSARSAVDSRGRPYLELVLRLHWAELSVDPDLNVSFRAELLYGTEVVASEFVSLRSRDLVEGTDVSSMIVDLGPYTEAVTKDPDGWSLRLRGVINPMHWPTYSARYWAGSIEFGFEELLGSADKDPAMRDGEGRREGD
jgi:hypothetical protein